MQRKRNYIAVILMMMLLVSLCHMTVFTAGEESITSEKQTTVGYLFLPRMPFARFAVGVLAGL